MGQTAENRIQSGSICLNVVPLADRAGFFSHKDGEITREFENFLALGDFDE